MIFHLSVFQVVTLSRFYAQLFQINVRLQTARLYAVCEALRPTVTRLEKCNQAYGTDYGNLVMQLRALVIKESTFLFLSDPGDSLRLDDEWLQLTTKITWCLKDSRLDHDFSREEAMIQEIAEWQSAIRVMIVKESMWLSQTVGQVAADILDEPERATEVLQRLLMRLSRMATSPRSFINAPMPTA